MRGLTVVAYLLSMGNARARKDEISNQNRPRVFLCVFQITNTFISVDRGQTPSSDMKKTILICSLLATIGALAAPPSQKSPEQNRLFEEAQARQEEPATKAYVIPQIADLQMLSQNREIFGPYRVKLNKPGELSEGELANLKGRALYRATIESDADLMIGVLYDSYILESDTRYIVVELSGYPAKFINFRPLPLDADMTRMINICYPAYNNQQQ